MMKALIAVYLILSVIVETPFGNFKPTVAVKLEGAASLASEATKPSLNPVFFISEHIDIVNADNKSSRISFGVIKLEPNDDVFDIFVGKDSHTWGVFGKVRKIFRFGTHLDAVINFIDACGRLPAVCYFQFKLHTHQCLASMKDISRFNFDPQPSPLRSEGDNGSPNSGPVRLQGQKKRKNKKSGTNPSRYCHLATISSHPLSGFIHALLGGKTIYLALASFLLSALTGLGLYIVIDNLSTSRSWKRFGWCLLLTCVPLGVLARTLGVS